MPKYACSIFLQDDIYTRFQIDFDYHLQFYCVLYYSKYEPNCIHGENDTMALFG